MINLTTYFYVNFCKIIKIYHYLQKTNDFTGILRPQNIIGNEPQPNYGMKP